MYTLDVLNKLNDIKEDRDIKSLSHAVFPGTHCPLFGVALSASYIKNMVLLVVGTAECTYYAKNFSMHRQKGKDKVYSLAIKEKEVVFGAESQLKKAIKQIVKNDNPDAVMVVSTCVPEVIGEDYTSLQFSLEDEIGIPIYVVNTDHFTCNSHIPGMTKALKVLASSMYKFEDQEGVNILGHRQNNIEETELFNLLKKHGVKINTIIPSKCDIAQIRNASKSKLNIVTDMIALDLAKEMKEKFDINYIYFDKHMNKGTIATNYEILSNLLGIDLISELEESMKEYDTLYEKCSSLLNGKKLIYGNTPMMAFETVDFLMNLGMEPVFIQVRELYEQDIKYKENISNKGYNPYISRIANIAPLRDLYDAIGAEVYIGHENPMLLKQKGLTQITLDEHAQKIGFELPIGMMKSLIKLFNLEEEGSKGGMVHGIM